MTAQKMSAQEIIAFIGNAEKKTNVKVTFEGELSTAVPASVTKLGNVLFGDWKDIEPLLTQTILTTLIAFKGQRNQPICYLIRQGQYLFVLYSGQTKRIGKA